MGEGNDGGGEEKQPPSSEADTPMQQRPSQFPERKEFLLGELSALSGAEEGGKPILTSQDYYYFF